MLRYSDSYFMLEMWCRVFRESFLRGMLAFEEVSKIRHVPTGKLVSSESDPGYEDIHSIVNGVLYHLPYRFNVLTL